MSNSLTRIANPIDSILRVFDAAGNLLATNDDEFEARDSDILDLKFTVGGTYYVEVDTYTPDGRRDFDTGGYELLIYSFAAVVAPLAGAPKPVGDTLITSGGSAT